VLSRKLCNAINTAVEQIWSNILPEGRKTLIQKISNYKNKKNTNTIGEKFAKAGWLLLKKQLLQTIAIKVASV
jgi:hypothetical protein